MARGMPPRRVSGFHMVGVPVVPAWCWSVSLSPHHNRGLQTSRAVRRSRLKNVSAWDMGTAPSNR